jgi:hypothetical protein
MTAPSMGSLSTVHPRLLEPAGDGGVRDELHLPWAIWFDADGDPADGLHEKEQPGDLRPNGAVFASVMSK